MSTFLTVNLIISILFVNNFNLVKVTAVKLCSENSLKLTSSNELTVLQRLFSTFSTESDPTTEATTHDNVNKTIGNLKLSLEPISGLNCTNKNDWRLITIQLSNGTSNLNYIDSEGVLTLGPEKELFSTNDFCINKMSEKEIDVQVCEKIEKCSTNCIQKCCGEEEVYDLTNYEQNQSIECVPSSIKWNLPTFYKDKWNKLSNAENEEAVKSVQLISNHPRNKWCSSQGDPVIYTQRQIGNESKYLFRVLENGTVLIKNPHRTWTSLAAGTFCIDGAQNFLNDQSESSLNSTVFTSWLYSGNENDLIIIDCSSPAFEKQTSTNIIYGVFQSIASFFLLLTISVYAVLWERQNIHSWTLMGYAISTFCMHASLIITYFYVSLTEIPENNNNNIFTFCTFIAVTTHFFFLCTFCWLTLINFDVWWTFRNLQLPLANSMRRRRFLSYFMFAVSLPSFIILVALTLDYIYKEDIESDLILAEYGGSKCFLDLEYAIFPFLYLPIALLLGINLVFFAMTIYALYKIGESTKFATNMSSHSQTAKAKLMLFMKLFFVMGLSWCLEFISWAIFGTSTNPLVYIIDILNILQPVAIFVIFVCKIEIVRGLQQKFPSLRKMFNLLLLNKTPAHRLSGLGQMTFVTNISSSSVRSISDNQQISLETLQVVAAAESRKKSLRLN